MCICKCRFCWPDISLTSSYPDIDKLAGKRFLNSGGFIGYAPQVNEIVNHKPIANKDDDQLYYTRIYLNKKLRNGIGISLDHKANIFQNLNGAVGDVELKFYDTEAFVENTAYRTHPKVIHGNGASKVHLNTLGNYLARSWSHETGCMSCGESRLNVTTIKPPPLVLIGLFIERPTPFLDEFFEYITQLKYPKSRIGLFIRNNVDHHNSQVSKFIKSIDEQKLKYTHVVELPKSDYPEWKARELGM